VRLRRRAAAGAPLPRPAGAAGGRPGTAAGGGGRHLRLRDLPARVVAARGAGGRRARPPPARQAPPCDPGARRAGRGGAGRKHRPAAAVRGGAARLDAAVLTLGQATSPPAGLVVSRGPRRRVTLGGAGGATASAQQLVGAAARPLLGR